MYKMVNEFKDKRVSKILHYKQVGPLVQRSMDANIYLNWLTMAGSSPVTGRSLTI